MTGTTGRAGVSPIPLLGGLPRNPQRESDHHPRITGSFRGVDRRRQLGISGLHAFDRREDPAHVPAIANRHPGIVAAFMDPDAVPGPPHSVVAVVPPARAALRTSRRVYGFASTVCPATAASRPAQNAQPASSPALCT